jgi:hypothetical protein
MISNKLSQIEPPLNYPHTDTINDLIFKQIDYTKETIEVHGENLTSRDVNFTPHVETNLFNYISDDCNPPTIYEESTKEKYARLLTQQKSCDSSSSLEENIDSLISNMKSEISSINSKITRIRTLTRAPWAYLQPEDLNIEEDDKIILENSNAVLQNFIDEEDRLELSF